MEIVEVEISKLKPARYNPRIITKDEFAGLRKSIETFGFVEPLVINKDYTVIGGHQRLEAAKQLGYKTVPCYAVDLNKTQEKKLNVVLNSQAISGKYDQLKLDELLVDLRTEADYLDLRLDELESLDLSDKEVKEDDFEAPKKAKYKVELGDIYQLGDHRLMCGDSTKIEDVEVLMNGEKADMVFTDPPYNADYSSRVDKTRRKPWGGILNDNMSFEAFEAFLLDLNASTWSVSKEGAAIYECIDWKHYPQLAAIFADAFTHKSSIIWNKNYFGLGTYYRTKYEMILFGIKGDKLKTWNAGHNEMDVWEEDREKVSNYAHPTQKPVTIPARAINNSSKKGDIVSDLFGGSGSTLIACEQTNRKCYMMELDPFYCSVIIERWEKLTGKQHKKL